MGIITKEVKVMPSGRSIQHYKNLGYDARWHEPLIVKIEDLPSGSRTKIECLCDYCQKEIITLTYADYNRRTKEVNKIACRSCFTEKMADVSLLRYGTTSYLKTEEYRNRLKEIMQSKYGVSHYSKTQEYKEKWNKTCAEKYGENFRKQFMDKAMKTFSDKTGYDYPSQSPEVREKMIQSCICHYGVENPQLSDEIRSQTEKTCKERYGYFTPLQSPEIKEKISKTSYKNGTIPTSRQQLYVFNLYKSLDCSTELNYSINHYNADICFPKEKITIEVDFGGHNLSVKTGQITQEEFDKKEIIRNSIIKREGYKSIHIISTSDKLPSDSILLQMLQDARNYFSEYPNHSWIEFNLDTSTVRNAEHKDSILYDFGTLRRIKDEDIANIETQQNKKGA